MNRVNLIRNQMLNKPNLSLIEISTSKVNEKVKILTMNSQSNLNALSEQMSIELLKAFDYLMNDDSTKVVIITGKGKAFIAGADIKHLSTLTYEKKLKQTETLHKLNELFYSNRKPVIAAINGFCFGGGLEMALNCDIILSSDKAAFGFPEIKLGLFPGLGGTQKFTKLAGYNKACEYIFTGKNIPLDECVKFGVVNQVYKPEELMQKSEEMASQIANNSLMALINSKIAIQMANEVGLKHGLIIEKAIFDSQFNFNDTKEGVTAFIDKRKANFKDN